MTTEIIRLQPRPPFYVRPEQCVSLERALAGSPSETLPIARSHPIDGPPTIIILEVEGSRLQPPFQVRELRLGGKRYLVEFSDDLIANHQGLPRQWLDGFQAGLSALNVTPRQASGQLSKPEQYSRLARRPARLSILAFLRCTFRYVQSLLRKAFSLSVGCVATPTSGEDAVAVKVAASERPA